MLVDASHPAHRSFTMKSARSIFLLPALVAFGLTVGASAGQASPLSTANAISSVSTVEKASAETVVKVDHRRRHHANRHHRHRHHHHWRKPRPRSGFYFEFGTGGYHSRPPVYVRPRPVAPRYVRRLPSAHVQWCYNRYRSYRHSDNTFQPYHGPRKACVSPYFR